MIPINVMDDDMVCYRLNLSGYYTKQWMAHEMFQQICRTIGCDQRIAEQREQLLESMYLGCRLQYRVQSE
jgi:hypothetical protein